MRRPHPLVVLLLALVFTGITFFFPPLFPTGGGQVEHGFPFPWAFRTQLPGSTLPIIGPLITGLSAVTLTFQWQFFLADTAIFMAILFFVFNSLGGREEE